MMHSGQEFARSKIIPENTNVEDEMKGKIDHNSYNKDNETNYINYNHAETNKELVDYYTGLIELRKKYPAFRQAKYEEITFYDSNENEFALGFHLSHGGDEFIVLFNANLSKEEKINLPEGKWGILVNKETAGIKVLDTISNEVVIEPSTGIVLKRKNI